MVVSIIIVNYNTKNLISNCLSSVFVQTIDVDYEIIVVDNASTDGSQQLIALNFPTVKLIELNDNIGFGRANNEGLRIANGDYILFLNPDTVLINNAVKILSDFLKNNTKSGACGGNLLDENLKPTHSFRLLFPSIFYELNELLLRIPEKIFLGKNREYNYSVTNKSVAHIIGADLMIKRKVIDEVGCFNPLFFLYFEETDLCYRIMKAGFDIKSIPDAFVQHLEGKSLGNNKINKERIYLFEKSRKIFYSIHYSKKYCKTANLIYLINIKLRICLQKLLNHKALNFWKVTLDEFKIT